MTNQIFRRLASTSQMMSIFDDEAVLQAMLDFERALAVSEAQCGLFESSVADSIGECCKVSRFSIPDLSEAATQHGTIVVPLVEQLTKLVSTHDNQASGWVHFGATSQDVIDTAMVIQLKKAIRILSGDFRRLVLSLDNLFDNYCNQIMIGRTLLQPSVPIPFGQKVFGWKSAASRNWSRVEDSAAEANVLQFGGAGGNLSSLESDGEMVKESLARILELGQPDAVWHTHRDRLVSLCSTISIFVGGLGKIALDISLLMQPEVGEVFETFDKGRGRSSAMPHKRNPIGCLVALAAAKRVPHLLATLVHAMPQEHERALGGWQLEWITIPAIFEAAAGSVSAVADMCDRLKVNPNKMEENLEALKGVLMSERVVLQLAKKIGKTAANEIIAEACDKAYAEGRHLSQVLKSNKRFVKEIGPDELDKLMILDDYLGASIINKRGK